MSSPALLQKICTKSIDNASSSHILVCYYCNNFKPYTLTVLIQSVLICLTTIVITLSNGSLYAEAQSSYKDLISPKEEILTVKVIDVLEENYRKLDGRKYINQKLKVYVTEGSIKNRTVTILSGNVPVYRQGKYQTDDKLIVGYLNGGIGKENFYIISYVRTDAVIILLIIFFILTLSIGRRKGFMSFAGMIASFMVIFIYIVPYIARGSDPVFVSLIGVSIIIPLTFYLSHGFNHKTSIAIGGTIISLVVTGLLARIFVEAAHLTGLVYEEVETLLYVKNGEINLQGLLVAGIIIGTLGILDDVSVSQSSIVEQLKQVSPQMRFKELYYRAMAIGKDHIASVVNTLILVYTGTSLSTILLFTEFPRPLKVILNNEIVIIQIVVALIGSIGLILTVPVTTFLSCLLYTKSFQKLQKMKDNYLHSEQRPKNSRL